MSDKFDEKPDELPRERSRISAPPPLPKGIPSLSSRPQSPLAPKKTMPPRTLGGGQHTSSKETRPLRPSRGPARGNSVPPPLPKKSPRNSETKPLRPMRPKLPQVKDRERTRTTLSGFGSPKDTQKQPTKQRQTIPLRTDAFPKVSEEALEGERTTAVRSEDIKRGDRPSIGVSVGRTPPSSSTPLKSRTSPPPTSSYSTPSPSKSPTATGPNVARNEESELVRKALQRQKSATSDLRAQVDIAISRLEAIESAFAEKDDDQDAATIARLIALEQNGATKAQVTVLTERVDALAEPPTGETDISGAHSSTLVDALKERLSNTEDTLKALQEKVTHQDALSTRLRETEEALKSLQEKITGQDTFNERINALEKMLAAVQETQQAPKLSTIKGIGPKFAAALKALGVKSPSDVAKWSGADVTRFAKEMGVPEKRALGWVEHAKTLS